MAIVIRGESSSSITVNDDEDCTLYDGEIVDLEIQGNHVRLNSRGLHKLQDALTMVWNSHRR